MDVTAEDLEVMARTIYGEARSEGWMGMVAVGHVIKNRAAVGGWWGDTIKEVCLKPYQFSCHNPNDPNRPKLLSVTSAKSAQFRECLGAAAAVLCDVESDVTNQADHYLNPDALAHLPDWYEDSRVTARIGRHVFLRLREGA